MGRPTDLISFDSWEFSATADPSATPTSEECSSLSTAPSMDLLLDHLDAPTPRSKNVEVSVSGVVFSLSPSAFDKMAKLPWRSASGNRFRSLHTSPVLFELLLNYILFQTLPPLSDLTTSDLEELEPLATLLELTGLQDHLQHKSSLKFPLLQRKHTRSSSDEGSSPTGLFRKMQAAVMNRRSRKMTHAEICAGSQRLY